jgi:glycerol-3-phosphate dehydrogenase
VSAAQSRTATDVLPGGAPVPRERLFAEGVARGLSEPAVAHLLGQYGSETPEIYSYLDARADLALPVHPHHGAIGAQVVHAVRVELARRLDDVLRRRLSIESETPDGGLAAIDAVAAIMARELGWDEGRRREESDRYRDLAHAIPRGRSLS